MVLPGASFLAAGTQGGGALAPASTNALTASTPSHSFGFPGEKPTASSGSSPLFSGISPTFASAPWVRSLDHTGPTTRALTSLPNINIIKGAYTSVSGIVNPTYASPPAPLGIGDFGLGSKTYSYNTSHILGEITFNTPPNATNPGATGVIEPSPGGQHEGAIGSPYTFGIQLNTIATNITIPGSNSNFFWTQNVVNWNGSGIHFVDDTFNATGSFIAPGTIYSACNNNSAGDQTILDVYGGVFQCVGGTIPVTPASYPVTLQLYNNASTNAFDQSQVTYGYRIVEAGTGAVYTGISDTVVFNNPTASPPPTVPGFSVDGFQTTPGGFLRDSEIVLVGGIGGDNAAFRSINGTVNLEYSNASVGGWQNVPSAYNFGGDTGETSVGIADYWTPSHTLVINTGPALLYGLWNSEPQVAVKSGDIQISGSIAPIYGFVFVGNLAPDVYGTNMSWFPTTDAGTFNTYLPPLGAPWTTHYYVQAFAAGYAELNGTAIAGTTTGYTLTLAASLGSLRAPLYMFSNAQASALADALTGSPAPPYIFSHLVVNMNFTFNHVNDYTYPVFTLFMAQGVTQLLHVNNITQGRDSDLGNFYFYDYSSAPPGILPGPGEILPFSLAGYTSEINIFGGTNDRVTNETLNGITFGAPYPLAGGEVILWQDTGATVWDTNVLGSNGIWAGNSLDTSIGYVFADYKLDSYPAIGVQDIGSTHTTVWNASANDLAIGIEGFSNVQSTYSWVNVTNGSLGIETGFDEGEFGVYNVPYYDEPGSAGLTVNQLNVTGVDSLGANITLSEDTTFNDVSTYNPSLQAAGGIDFDAVTATTINSLVANYGYGADLWNATGTTINHYVLENAEDFGSFISRSTGTTINSLTVFDYYAGIEATTPYNGGDLTTTAFNNVNISESETGIALENVVGTSFTNVNVSETTFGISVTNGLDTTYSNLMVYDDEFGVEMVGAATTTFTTVNVSLSFVGINVTSGVGTTFTNLDIFSSDVGVEMVAAATTTFTTVNIFLVDAGVEIYGATDTSIVGLTVEFVFGPGGVLLFHADGTTLDNIVGMGATAVWQQGGSSVTVTDVTGTGGIMNFAVIIEYGTGATINGVTASDNSGGVGVEFFTDVTVTNVAASDPSIGFGAFESHYITVTTVTATGQSIGVEVEDSSWTTVTDATVSNMSAAVYSVVSSYTRVSGVTATNTTLSGPWLTSNPFGMPGIAAVVTSEDQLDAISDVSATTYPAAYYDYASYDPGVSNVNATSGTYAIVLNDTYYGTFTNIGAYLDWVGVQINDDASYNVITMSAFVDCTSYGVAIFNGYYNVVYENTFIGDNGATNIYNAAHIQAYSGYGNQNYFYFEDTGNYWADWHTYNQYGELAPYPIGDNTWDYYPLGGPEGTVAVYFYGEGLASGVDWGVTLNGNTVSTTNSYLTFWMLPGTYAFTAGSVPGYTVSPASGMVMVSGSYVDVDLTYTAQYNVSITASGVPSGTSWSATLGGVTASGTAATLNFTVGAGTYAYQIAPIAGYTASPSSGSVTVVASNYNLGVTFTQATYAVTISESGLSSGSTWSATLNGATQSTSGSSLTWYLPNGTYPYSSTAPSGYSGGGSGTVVVNGAPSGAAIGFSSSSTSLVSSGTFNTWFALAIIIAVIALVVALIALMMRRRESPPPAQAWTGPQGSSSSSTSTSASGSPPAEEASSGSAWDEQGASDGSSAP
jgi:hypothetical protein